MFEPIAILTVIGGYYVCNRRILSLENLPQPIFIVNVLYLLNFPLRAIVLLLVPDWLESAPSFVLDFATLSTSLLYSFACVLVFNISYRYFTRNVQPTPAADQTSLPACDPVPPVVFWLYLLLASLYLYYALPSVTNKMFPRIPIESDIPTVVRALDFTLHVAILSSFLMALLMRRKRYVVVFLLLTASLLYNSLYLTAKYPVFAYVLLLGIVLIRAGHTVNARYVVPCLTIFVCYVVYSYLARSVLAFITPEMGLAARLSLVGGALFEFGPFKLLLDLFLLKITDRFVYLETLMVYMQSLSANVSLDLYDRFGSLPLLPNILGHMLRLDVEVLENLHVWFGNKYWYGLSWPGWDVVIPFGRITESFMILSWLGFILFVGYAFLFSLLYRVFYLSRNPLSVIYYLLVYYYYVLVDDYLFYNLSTILYFSGPYFLAMFVEHAVRRRRRSSSREGEPAQGVRRRSPLSAPRSARLSLPE